MLLLIRIFFFQKADQYSNVFLYHIFFIHSPITGHTGWVLILTIVNNAEVNMEVQVPPWYIVFIYFF
jgi:hypothetical protein